MPPEACTRQGYKEFFEAFARSESDRAVLSMRDAPLARVDLAMLDYRWVLATNKDTLLDIAETAAGDTFSVRVRLVERDENDEISKVLGPTRTYGFRYVDECWKFASLD